MRNGDVGEIKRHIDRCFYDLKRDMELKAQQEQYRREAERYRVEARREMIILGLATALILAGSVYNNWDIWKAMLG